METDPPPGVVSLKVYGVVLVCDLEDYSLWCQTVDSTSVAALGTRFLETAARLSELFGAAFVKSTGDGAIGVWTHELVESDEEGSNPADEEAAARDVLRACLLGLALQILTELGFAFSWPIPRRLRCAVHVGTMYQMFHTRHDREVQTDFVGESLNAACRLEKLGSRVRGAVLSEHAARILARTGHVLPSEVPLDERPELKSAQWLGGRVYGQPSADLLQRTLDGAGGTEAERRAITAKFKKNAEGFMEALLFEAFSAILEYSRAGYRVEPPAWLSRLSPQAQRVIGDPCLHIDPVLADDYPDLFHRVYERFRTEVDRGAPSFEVLRRQLEAAIRDQPQAVQDLVAALFPPKRRKRGKRGNRG